MSCLAFLDIGFGEMLVVAFVALILFGGRLPEVMRSLGTSYRNFRRGMEDMTRSVTRPDLGLKQPPVPYRPIPPAATTLPPAFVTPPSPPPSAVTAAVTEPVAATPTTATTTVARDAAPASPAAPTTTPSVQAPPVRVDDDTPDV